MPGVRRVYVKGLPSATWEKYVADILAAHKRDHVDNNHYAQPMQLPRSHVFELVNRRAHPDSHLCISHAFVNEINVNGWI